MGLGPVHRHAPVCRADAGRREETDDAKRTAVGTVQGAAVTPMRGFYAWVAVAWTLLWAYMMIAMMGIGHPGAKVILR